MNRLFDDKLLDLNNNLVELGSQIEKAIDYTVKALVEHDTDLAKRVVKFSSEIGEKEKEVESACLKLLLHHQPVARDLRLISSALKMITDMERIGHQCADISKIILEMGEAIEKLDFVYIPKMAETTKKMVTTSIDAFVKKDMDIALSVIEKDDEVDTLFKQVKKKMIDMLKEEEKNNEQMVDILMIAKYLERIGDHTVNIAEWVVFSITGKHTEIQ